MSEQKKFNAVKVTCSTGKVVILREMQIKHTEQAAQLVAPRAKGDSTLLQLFMQKELVKLLLVQIDGKDVSADEKEDLNSILSMAEYAQVLKIIGKMNGGDDEEEGKTPKLEMISA